MTRLLAILALVSLAGCGGGSDVDDGRLRVVATTGMIADVAARIGGPDAVVDGLMGPGVDPHLYRAGEGDVRLLQRADLVLYNGLHLESRMGDVLESMTGRRPVAAVAEAVPPERRIVTDGAADPHVWFDVALWSMAAGRIRDAMVAADPDRSDAYAARADTLLAELESLDREVRELLADVPPEHRVLVTAHDAFGYFGAAYGFEVKGLQGISTASEAGARDVQELATFIADRGIPAVFVETSVSPRAIAAVREAVAARGAAVGLGDELYSDALGSPGSGADTYAGMVRSNVRAIVEGLGAEAAR